MGITIGVAAVLLAFDLYLLVRKDGIVRPLCYWIGVGGLALTLIAQTLGGMGTSRAFGIIGGILYLIGVLAALAGAVAAAYRGKLPMGLDSKVQQASGEQPPAGGGMDIS